MRNAGYVLALSLLLTVGCRSRGASEDETQEPVEDPTVSMEDSEGSSPETSTDPTQGDAASEMLAEEARQLTLAEQKKRFLVEGHLAKAEDLLNRMRLEEARDELVRALDLDPDSLEVKEKLAEVGALLGEPSGEVETVTQTLNDEFELRVQQLKAQAEDSYRKAKLKLARGDYDGAIAELSICLNHIRWAPYSVDWDGLDEDAQTLLERTKEERSAAKAEARRVAQREAYDRLKTEEEAQAARREAVVANMLDRSIESFENEDYDESMAFAEQALRKDPRNEKASEIRDAAFRASREKVRRDYIEAKREQFKVWQEEMQELLVPWTNVITNPDPEVWQEITELRSRRRGFDISQKISPSDLALREQLRRTTLRMGEVDEEESLGAVVGIIRTITGLPLVVDPAAENAVYDAGNLFDFTLENQVTAEQALNLIAQMAGEEVIWTVKHDAVLFTTVEKGRGEPIPLNHPVQDLIFGLTDFLGPRIGRLRLLDELEDDDGGGPFGGIGETPRLIEIDNLVTLIQDNVAPGTWEDDGISIEAYEGSIMAVHTPEVQDQVRQFLEDLRRFSSSLVTIESKFMVVGDNWLQEIGVDFRGLDDVELTDVTNGLEDNASRGLDNSGSGTEGQNAAGSPSGGFFYDDGNDGDMRGRTENYFGDALGSALSNIGGMTFQWTFLDDIQMSAVLRAVEKTSQFNLVNSQVLSVHNTQRAYVTVVNQQAYIQDFDVEVAQFQAVADPQVNVLHEGVVLDVRPTIHYDRRYLTLEVQPTVSQVVALRDFSSTLGGNTSPISFQLPELEVQSVFTTAVIPDGGSILLGGLSRLRNIERRAEVPWLGRIPLVGFLMKSEGYNDEKETLLILIRAQITDVREEMERVERNY